MTSALNHVRWSAVVLVWMWASALPLVRLAAQPPGDRPSPGFRGEARLPTLAFRTDVPPHPYDLILSRATPTSITFRVLAYQDFRAAIAYGTDANHLDLLVPTRPFAAGHPTSVVLAGLRPGTRYYYQFRPDTPEATVPASEVYRFTTARPPGSAFTFTVQADSHLDFGTDPDVYVKSLRNALAAQPDFHVDLGDTFMTDKRTHFRDALPQYLAQRYYLGLIGCSAPLYLVLGNHDGEETTRGGTGPDSMAVWSNLTRKMYFANPLPDGFYSGNTTTDPQAGLLEDYYAFEWGDALFMVLDPYWYNAGRGRDSDNWSRTLGRAQYDWLRRTLDRSRAKFTFVFTHNLVGGETREGRGGAEAARYFEWGGADLDGHNTFALHRPGWPAPIHDLLANHGHVVVFHGHDHFFARQERDNVIYQLVPQPDHSRVDDTRSAADYGYKSGIVLGASGILRVSVSSESATIEYVRAYPSSAENETHRSGSVAYTYTVAASSPTAATPQ